MEPSGTAPPYPAYRAFGEFVRTQRAIAQLSLRQASQIARISNPYLSQIEHGWVLPSVSVMSKLAEAFSVSAETILSEAAVAASGTSPRAPSTEEAIQRDPRLSIEEKKALLLILASFTRNASAPPATEDSATESVAKANAQKAATKASAKKASAQTSRPNAASRNQRSSAPTSATPSPAPSMRGHT